MRRMTFKLEDLDVLTSENKAAVSNLLKHKRKFSAVSLFLLAAIQRVESNIAGFRSMVSSNNYPIACAILRMQIDTAMRVYGLRLMADPHDGAMKLLAGERYDRIEPKSKGDKLRDSVLLTAIDREYGWIQRVYNRVSGMVHLSGMHIHHAIDYSDRQTQEDGSLAVSFVIGPSVPTLPAELYDELTQAFLHASAIASTIALARLNAEQDFLNRDR